MGKLPWFYRKFYLKEVLKKKDFRTIFRRVSFKILFGHLNILINALQEQKQIN